MALAARFSTSDAAFSLAVGQLSDVLSVSQGARRRNWPWDSWLSS
jgi:hypothetical protein